MKRIWRNLADALDLGSSAFGRVGSTPTMRTIVTDDPPKLGSVRLPGVARDSAPPMVLDIGLGGVKRCQHASKGPTSQRRRPPTIFSLLWLGAFRHAWRCFLQPNASGAVSRSKMGEHSPMFPQKGTLYQ